MSHLYDFDVQLNNGDTLKLADMQGRKVLLVNTASKCGFTSQYAGLQKLADDQTINLAVIGFPCNQFSEQEPGSDEEIQSFCQLNFGVSFPLSEKVDVNGSNATPVFKFAAAALPGLLGSTRIKWNFTKFLFDEAGEPVKRFAPKDTPEMILQFLSRDAR
jgi:glutathione peroxidase